jgi:3'-phosphoadenosine 5'-phosphosulfate sulfotransferase (PAPS reductase)/FAD synthetase
LYLYVAMKQTRMLSLGAGVQSTTVALLAVHGEIEKPAHAIFADTGWEPQEVYDHLQWLTPILENAGIQVHIVTAGNIRNDTLSAGRFASMPFHMKHENGGTGLGRRQCTNEYKIQPILKKQRELIGVGYRKQWKEQHGEIINLMGISVDEIQRAKDNRVKYIKNQFPLLDLRMKRTDCLAWLEKHGYSAPRSACIGCPYHNDHEWRRIKQNPTEWADVVLFDKQLRNKKTKFNSELYLHKSCKPLDEVDLRTEEEQGQYTLFDNECEGMCGL